MTENKDIRWEMPAEHAENTTQKWEHQLWLVEEKGMRFLGVMAGERDLEMARGFLFERHQIIRAMDQAAGQPTENLLLISRPIETVNSTTDQHG